uniref:Uncharacterized protein n=1 Tax=Setaria viridis TaxID=4556 RepID=A0A4U6T7H3_SETVI|nr:hypothetical protein SEVIR_9G192450v2 [Setaria viridis]
MIFKSTWVPRLINKKERKQPIRSYPPPMNPDERWPCSGLLCSFCISHQAPTGGGPPARRPPCAVAAAPTPREAAPTTTPPPLPPAQLCWLRPSRATAVAPAPTRSRANGHFAPSRMHAPATKAAAADPALRRGCGDGRYATSCTTAVVPATTRDGCGTSAPTAPSPRRRSYAAGSNSLARRPSSRRGSGTRAPRRAPAGCPAASGPVAASAWSAARRGPEPAAGTRGGAGAGLPAYTPRRGALRVRPAASDGDEAGCGAAAPGRGSGASGGGRRPAQCGATPASSGKVAASSCDGERGIRRGRPRPGAARRARPGGRGGVDGRADPRGWVPYVTRG